MRTHRIHKPIRIDFTPLASIALLLTFFFVFLEVNRQDRAMPLNIPGGIMCHHGERAHVDAQLFLLANNRIGFLQYTGKGVEAEFSEIGYLESELDAQLISISLSHTCGGVVLVAPTAESTYKNLVDIFNGINRVGDIRFSLNTYLTNEEKNILSLYEAYKSNMITQPATMRTKQ